MSTACDEKADITPFGEPAMTTSPQPSPDPAAQLLKLEQAREARRERIAKEVRQTVAAVLIILLVLLVFGAWAASR